MSELWNTHWLLLTLGWRRLLWRCRHYNRGRGGIHRLAWKIRRTRSSCCLKRGRERKKKNKKLVTPLFHESLIKTATEEIILECGQISVNIRWAEKQLHVTKTSWVWDWGMNWSIYCTFAPTVGCRVFSRARTRVEGSRGRGWNGELLRRSNVGWTVSILRIKKRDHRLAHAYTSTLFQL